MAEPRRARTGPAGGRGRRRRRLVQVLVLGVIVAIGNAPFVGAWAMDTYDEWRSRQPEYMAQHGRWDTVADSGTRSVHAAMLSSGKVLMMAGSGNDQGSFDAKRFTTVLWDPKANTFEQVPTPWDVFCSGHSFLYDGNLLIAGGTKKYEILAQFSPDGKKHEYQGLKDSFVFNVQTERYERTASLQFARWYPTLVTLANGLVVAVAGLNDKGDNDPGNTESYNMMTKTWVHHDNLVKEFPTYPSLLLAADGRLFFSGASAGYGPTSLVARQSGMWNLHDNNFEPVPGLPLPEINETAGTVMLPPAQDQKVMFVAGGGVGDTQVATSRTAVVDLDAPNPMWERGPDVAVPKRYPGVVILPDDTLLISGGSERYRGEDTLTAEIYHPDTNTLTPAAAPRVGRNYHAEYLLLPDGRVAVFGSNPLTDENYFETKVEVYSPAYMYRGERPVITSAPKQVTYGATVEISASQQVAKARLIRPGAYTHVTDTEVRSVALDLVGQQGETLQVTVPQNPNLLPPGWYMLFVTNSDGLPSEAAWVHVG